MGNTQSIAFDDVDRKNIIVSAMENVSRNWNKGADAWLDPLEVNFKGEYAIDAGGPRKEFFHLLFQALLDTTKLSIFRKLDETSISPTFWFDSKYEDHETLAKIGLLFALLLVNECIVTLPFPLLFYEKLLKRTPYAFKDLERLDPQFADQMKQLRIRADSEDPEKQKDFDNELEYMDFSELQPKGENVPVSRENLDEYIDLSGKHQLAVHQLASFTRGFDLVASRSLKMTLLKAIRTPKQLRDAIVGGRFEWEKFESTTLYKYPYSPDHPVIKRFWKVFHEMEESDKRKFLVFLTGADHVPLDGFQSLGFTIRLLDTAKDYPGFPPADILPTVYTCPGYISMDLPEYESEEDARFRLKMALQMGLGYHRE